MDHSMSNQYSHFPHQLGIFMKLDELVRPTKKDWNVTWYTAIPDFTDCFQQIVFVLIPCFLFCLVGVPYFICCRKKHSKLSLPWTSLLIMKLVLCFLLIAINISELKYIVYALEDTAYVTICSHLMQVLTFLIVILILLQHRTNGVKTSSLLFLFWFIFSTCGTIVFRSIFLKIFVLEFPLVNREKFILSVISCTLIYCELYLSVFTDAKNYAVSEKQSPIEEVPAFLFVAHFWMSSLIFKSRKRLLTIEDFDPLSPLLKAGNQWEKFKAKWITNLVAKVSEDSSVEIRQPSSWSLVMALIKAFWPWILYSAIFELLCTFARVLPPLTLDLIINFIGSQEYSWKGYLFCFIIFISSIIDRFLKVGGTCFPTLLAIQIKAAFRSAIYRKVLKISSSTRRKYMTGELINLIAVDVDKIFDVIYFSALFFALPLRMLLSMILLWQYIGLACLSGIVVIVLILVVTLVIAKINNSMQVRQMAMKDIRMKNMSEILSGIKVLKFWAWEDAFIKNVTDIRKKEVNLLRNYLLCYAASSFFYNCTPLLVAVVSFATYVLMDERNVLLPSTVFVSLNLFNNLKYVLFELPNFMSNVVQAKVSLGRLKCFLVSEEIVPNLVGNLPDKGDDITIRNASFSWDRGEATTLKNINLHVQTGKLVAIIGLVGSGKSSLLSALLGSMYKLCGSIDLQGRLAYVPQQAWIRNQTVRDNILFMKSMDEHFYNSVLNSCCLKTDLKILPGGDKTEIGEKGVNLSGGQKHRISLARAVYQDADVYLLDDPLSAVDVHVGKDIFEYVIGRTGLLKDKTRILVTHNLSFLPNVDTIVCMRDGKIEEIGAYEELMGHNGPFSEFIQKHVGTTDFYETKEEKIFSPLSLSTESFEISRNKSIHSYSSVERLPYSSCSQPGVTLLEDEKMEIGEVKKTLYLGYVKHSGILIMTSAVFFYLSFQAFEIGGNFWLSEWSSDQIDPVTSHGESIILRNRRISVYAAIGACQGITTVVGIVLLFIGTTEASKVYHAQMLNSVMKSPMFFFDTTPQGRIMNRFSKDIDVIDAEVPLLLDAWFVCFFMTVGTFIVICMTMPLVTIALVPIGVAYYILQKLYLISARQIKRMESIRRSPVFSYFTETIQGVPCIKAFNLEDHVIKEFESKVDNNALCYFYWSSTNNWLTAQLDILSCLILLTVSVLAIYNRDLLEGAIVGLSLTYALASTDALKCLVRCSVGIENQSVSVERVGEYSNLTPEAPWHVSDHKPPDDWPKNGVVKLENYGTRYREGLNLVLDKINLEISSGEKIGIIGRTGAGKSSITLALFRIIEPVMGRILIDDVDVSKIGLHSLRSKLTIIPQDPVLFSGTLRFNLDPKHLYSDNELWLSLEHAHMKAFVSAIPSGLEYEFSEGGENLRFNLDPKHLYSDNELWLSLEHAHMKAFVSAIPSGLEYEFSEGGENLSVGQRQLMCLARALLKKTKILILDEATAAVDLETDNLIQETIRTEFSQRSVITIAHRLNTIMDYDRVIVMDAGKIIEIGKPSELLNDISSHFREMARNANLV